MSAKTGRGGAVGGTRGVPQRAGSREAARGPSIPGWAPAALFAVVTLLLFRAFVLSDLMLYGGDTESLGYMARAFYAEAVTGEGVFPRWNPLLLGGTPFLEALSGGDSLYPTALLLFVMEPYRALGWKLVIHVSLAGVFMYGWVRTLGASRAASTVAGLAYLLAPFLVTLVFPGHDGKLFVTALTPLLFQAMEWTFVRRGLLPYVAVAAVVALVILTTHFQMAYFLFGAAGLYYGFRCALLWRSALRRGEALVEESGVDPAEAPDGDGAGGTGGRARPLVPALSRFGLFLAASVLGAAAAGIQLVPALQYVTEFSRRTATTTAASAEENLAYAASWSLHPEEALATLAVPEFAGNNAGDFLRGAGMADWTTGTYWGRNPFKSNHEYVGLLVLLLAGLAFVGGRRGPVRWFMAGLGTVALLYALGAHTPAWRVFYEVLPGVSLFRAPSMAVFLTGFAAVTLAALGVDRLLRAVEGPDEGWTPVWRYLLGALALMAVLLVLAGSGALLGAWTSTLYAGIDPSKAQALQAARPYIQRGFLVAFLLVGTVAAAAWAARRRYLPAGGLVLALAVLVAVDLWRVDAPFVQAVDPARVTRPDPNVQTLVGLLDTEPPFRLWKPGDVQGVGPAAFGVELAGGHHPNDLARYRELVGMRGSGDAENLYNANVARLLNVRYVLWPTLQQGGEPPGTEVVSRSQLPDGRVYESLLRYPGLPRARMVYRAEVVAEGEAVARILEESFDPGATAVLAEPSPIELPGAPAGGTVTWEERGLNSQRLRVDTPENGLLVVADNWFPAWRAAVDGEEAPLLRAYHTLRAVPVPAGEHVVTLEYRSSSVRLGLALTLAASALLLVTGALSWSRGRRERRGREEEPSGEVADG